MEKSSENQIFLDDKYKILQQKLKKKIKNKCFQKFVSSLINFNLIWQFEKPVTYCDTDLRIYEPPL